MAVREGALQLLAWPQCQKQTFFSSVNSPGVSDADQCWRLKALACSNACFTEGETEKGGLNDENFRSLNEVPTFFSCPNICNKLCGVGIEGKCALPFFFSLFAMQQDNQYRSLQ